MMKNRIIAIGLFPIWLGTAALANYQVLPGDSLSKIAEAKYGSWIKWRNLWEANKANINNPNLIYPGQRLTLVDEEKLTLFASNSIEKSGKETSVPAPLPKKKKSMEWQLLPQQPWEKFVFKLDAAVDQDGFDRRSRVANRIADKTNAELTITSDRIPIVGEITGARTEFERIFLGESVFIAADEPLQVGITYSITTGPQKLSSKRDGRVGFAYDLTGKVRIIGVRDGVLIGTVTALYHPIQRRQLLIPVVNSYEFPEPVASETPITASVIVTKAYQEDLLGEQKVVFLDVGAEDGVKPGTIFRHYLHDDPANQKTISTQDFLIESELQILSVQDKFSVAVILNGRNAIRYGDEAISITDLTDLRHNGLQTTLQDHEKIDNIDALDELDNSEGLGERENHELKQLEKWSKPKPAPSLIPETVTDPDEIKKIDVHENSAHPAELGQELAPNDGTDQIDPKKAKKKDAPPIVEDYAIPAPPKPSEPATTTDPTTVDKAPEPTPEPEATPAPDATPSDVPPIREELPPSPPPLESPANGTPSGTDPFSIPEQPPISP